MKNFFKGKVATAIILFATFVLAGVAIFTAVRLYQLRQTSIAPNVPSSVPKAAGVASCNQECNITINPPLECQTGLICLTTSKLHGASGVCRNATCSDKTDCACTTTSSCSLSFKLTMSTPTATPTATPTVTPTITPTITPTPTAVPQCNTTCSQNSGCPSNLICSIASGSTTGNCRNTSCTGESDCICATATPTVTPHGTTNPTPAPSQPALPQSGTNWPTTFGVGIGILTIIGALLLAL